MSLARAVPCAENDASEGIPYSASFRGSHAGKGLPLQMRRWDPLGSVLSVLLAKRVRQKASKRLKEASEAHSAAFRHEIDAARPHATWHWGGEGLAELLRIDSQYRVSVAPGSAASRRCRSSARSLSPRRRRSEGPRPGAPRRCCSIPNSL